MQKRKPGQPHKGWKKAAQKCHEHRIGEYVVDYSPLSPEEIAASDPEMDALYERSKPVKS